MSSRGLVQLDDYRALVGDETVDRIHRKADILRGQRVVHMNSTYYAGGVVEILSSMVTLLNQLGIKAEWRLLRGTPDFFEVTRQMHDALQSADIILTDDKQRVYEDTIYENALRNHIDHDAVYMHDHHTMAMVAHYRKRGPWIWRCHLDLTAPHPALKNYLRQFAEQYSAIIYILKEYKQDFETSQFAMMPAIDPFKAANQEMTNDEILQCLERYGIPTDLPIVTQISRYDRWKDPHGVIDAFKRAQQEVNATLVLLGNTPSDDPDNSEMYDTLRARREERVIILFDSHPALVNALQRHATVVLQKSLREGFGLTVAEALWKGRPVIGGNAGGIPRQIDDGVNGYVVKSSDEAAQRIIELVSDPDKADEMGARGREKIRQNFLMTRLLENHLDLLGSFEANFIPGK